MKQLTNEQTNTLVAFHECYDLYGPGWQSIEQGMKEDFGVTDPETDLEAAVNALR